MNDSGSDWLEQPAGLRLAWEQFWFSPGSVKSAARVRAGLCVLTAIYFVGAWSDPSLWFIGDAPFATDRASEFLNSAGLERDARWTISPLFLSDGLLGSHGFVYYGYLLFGIGLCVAVSVGKGGQIAAWALWIVFVGWANRAMLLSGLSETLLSLGLFAAAIAPTASAAAPDRNDWRAGFSLRLMAAQITIFAACTLAAMLAGRVWWNGIGSFALLAPVEDRTFAFGNPYSVFASPIVHDTLTHLLVIALPIGFVLAWMRPRSWIGLAIIFAWCGMIAVLGSHWLYGLTFACTAMGTRVLTHDARAVWRGR